MKEPGGWGWWQSHTKCPGTKLTHFNYISDGIKCAYMRLIGYTDADRDNGGRDKRHPLLCIARLPNRQMLQLYDISSFSLNCKLHVNCSVNPASKGTPKDNVSAGMAVRHSRAPHC